MMQTQRPGMTLIEINRSPEPIDFLEPSRSFLNHVDMDWTFNYALLSTPEPSTLVDVNPTAINHSNDNSQTDGIDETCWLRSSPTNTQSVESNGADPHEAVAITAADGLDFLPEMCLAMKDNTTFVAASWQSMETLINHTPAILGRRDATNISQGLKMNFLWSRIESFVKDFNKFMLPPSIHQRFLLKNPDSQVFDFDNLPEPLVNCKNIVPMYMQKTPACTKLVLKTLLLEVQRLHTEFHDYDESTLLAALQAGTIYVILLAADKERCKLASMITRIAIGELANAVQKPGLLCAAEKRGNFPSWSDWTLQESKRRTMIVLHLMDYLLDPDVGKTQRSTCVGFDKMVLPCGKKLFSAKTTSAWEDEYKKYLSSRSGSGIPTVKDLREINGTGSRDHEDDLVKDLLMWSEDLDDLGSLLLMAV